MQIVDCRAEAVRPSVQGKNVTVGTYFFGNIGSVRGLFLRTYDGIVSLSDPSHTWIITNNAGFAVEGYQPVTVRIQVLENL